MERQKISLPSAGFILFLCISAFLVAGCGISDKAAGSGNTLEYASMWNEAETQAEYLRQVAADFEKETGIKVNLTFSDRDVLTKIKSRLLMGDPPDLVDQEFCELTSAVTIGDLEPLDLRDLLYNEKGPEGQERLIDIFGENRLKLYEKDGRLFMLPYELITSGFFYNEDLFSKYGLSKPAKWEDFIKTNEVLKQNGIVPLACDGNINFYNAYYYCWAVERVLGTGAFLNAAKDHTGKAWDDVGYLKAAELVFELSRKKGNYFQADYKKTEWPSAQNDWAGGKYGSILCSSWLPNETQKYVGPGFQYGFYPFPQVGEGKGRGTDVEIGYIGCAIPKDSKKSQIAKTFLKFLVKKENAQKFVSMANNISARLDVEYPTILSAVQEYTKDPKALYRPTNDRVWADLPEWWANVFLPLDDKLLYGELEPEAFISEIKKDSILFWSQNEGNKK